MQIVQKERSIGESAERKIDIVALNKNQGIFCECKWKNEQTGLDVYLSLIEKSKLVNEHTPKMYIIFSKSGFTSQLIQKAKEDKMVELVGLDGLFKI